MKVVVQRVKNASCIVDGKLISSIDKGLMLLVGFTHTDTLKEVEKMANKIAKLRIFEDENGKMNLSVKNINGSILSISQFTLYANPYEGNRPSFVNAMNPENATLLYEEFNKKLEELGFIVGRGIFGADMKLDILCDGPVTINLEF